MFLYFLKFLGQYAKQQSRKPAIFGAKRQKIPLKVNHKANVSYAKC